MAYKTKIKKVKSKQNFQEKSFMSSDDIKPFLEKNKDKIKDYSVVSTNYGWTVFYRTK